MLDRQVVIRRRRFRSGKGRANGSSRAAAPASRQAGQAPPFRRGANRAADQAAWPSGRVVRNVPIQCHEVKKDGAAAGSSRATRFQERRAAAAPRGEIRSRPAEFRFQTQCLDGVLRPRGRIATQISAFELIERSTARDPPHRSISRDDISRRGSTIPHRFSRSRPAASRQAFAPSPAPVRFRR